MGERQSLPKRYIPGRISTKKPNDIAIPDKNVATNKYGIFI